MAFGTFFAIWLVVFAIQYALLMVAGINNGPLLGAALAVLVIAGGWLFLALNANGWESSRFLSIGLGGGMGLVMMMNVWGVVWRCQKRLIAWTKESASSGAAMPPEAAGLARKAFLASRLNFYLSMPMLFFMAAASHYPMFGTG